MRRQPDGRWRGTHRPIVVSPPILRARWIETETLHLKMMLESVWSEFGAFVHQQIIWVKSRPVLTYSTYLWQHEPCLFGWIKGEKPKTLRNHLGIIAGEFPTTVWEVPSAEVETDAHPTCKPCRLFALPMEMHTERGDICYEPPARRVPRVPRRVAGDRVLKRHPDNAAKWPAFAASSAHLTGPERDVHAHHSRPFAFFSPRGCAVRFRDCFGLTPSLAG